MKKLMLLAPALALSGAAMAQSSVTVFGILDANLAYGEGSTSNKTQLTRGGLATPRIGFKGTEDLGGGLKAEFWLEGQVNTDDGQGGSYSTDNQTKGDGAGLNFARRATVAIIGNFGEVRLGRDTLAQYSSKGDVFGNVGVGSAINYTAMVGGETKVRASNLINYFSPSFNGLKVQLSAYFGENASGTATSDNGSGSGIGITYDKGPLQLGIGTGATQFNTGDEKQSYIQAGYNFGFARVTSELSSDRFGTKKGDGGGIGAVVPVGGSGQIKVGYSWYEIEEPTKTTLESKKYAIGYVYSLSKRTDVYTTVARVTNSGGAKQALNGATTAANRSSTGFDLGIKHSF